MSNCFPSATSVQMFNFQNDTAIRVSIINNEPYFVAKDVCFVLSIQNNRDAMQTLDNDEKLMSVVPTSGQNRRMWHISESGLYALIFQSRKPIAKSFRKWVTSEVLPAIRKTGRYGAQPAGYVSEQEYQHLAMMYRMEKHLCEYFCKERDYYSAKCDDWMKRTSKRTEMLIECCM